MDNTKKAAIDYLVKNGVIDKERIIEKDGIAAKEVPKLLQMMKKAVEKS